MIKSSVDLKLVKFGVKNASAKYPAERLPNNAENALSHGFENKNFTTLLSYSNK